jgi:hypothetical protein
MMTSNFLFSKYKEHFMFKVVMGMLLVAFIVGVGKSGFEFGQWLKH